MPCETMNLSRKFSMLYKTKLCCLIINLSQLTWVCRLSMYTIAFLDWFRIGWWFFFDFSEYFSRVYHNILVESIIKKKSFFIAASFYFFRN